MHVTSTFGRAMLVATALMLSIGWNTEARASETLTSTPIAEASGPHYDGAACGLHGELVDGVVTYFFGGTLDEPIGTLPAGTPFSGFFRYVYPQPNLNSPPPGMPIQRGDYLSLDLVVNVGGTTVTAGPGPMYLYDKPLSYPTDLWIVTSSGSPGTLGGLVLEPGLYVALQELTGSAWDGIGLPGADLTLDDLTVGNATFVEFHTTSILPGSTSVRGTIEPCLGPELVAVDVSPVPDGLLVDETAALQATGTYSDGASTDVTTEATWESDNTAVATVDASGVVTAQGVGTVTVTATLDGKSGTTTISVFAPLCAVGTFSTTGRAPCTPAPVDTFVATSGATAPTACPPGTSTGGLIGQTSCSPIYEFPVGGAFIIGDGAAQATGSSVTFWSAQWTGSNPTTAAAPNGLAAFKGFVPGNSVLACGGTWTANPGNSGNPPSVVPEYMAVVVTSAITRSGSNFRGNVTKILIVKTDPGYAGAPGHRGTGTVVGVLCGS